MMRLSSSPTLRRYRICQRRTYWELKGGKYMWVMADERITYDSTTEQRHTVTGRWESSEKKEKKEPVAFPNKRITEMDFKRCFMEIKRLFMCPTNSAAQRQRHGATKFSVSRGNERDTRTRWKWHKFDDFPIAGDNLNIVVFVVVGINTCCVIFAFAIHGRGRRFPQQQQN